MRKILNIFLLSIYLLGTTELHQLVKIPLLVEHFNQFEKVNPGFGLMTFLRVHYLYPQRSDDDDYDQDMRLPFKNADTHFMLIVGNAIVPQPYYFKAPKLFSPERKYLDDLPIFYLNTVSLTIFQPPKA